MEQKINTGNRSLRLKNLLFVAALHGQSLLVYCVMLYLFYIAERSWDLDMLLFYMNDVQSECLPYYLVMLCLVLLFIVARIKLLGRYRARTKIKYRYVALADAQLAVAAIPCWIFADSFVWGVVLVMYAFICMLVDKQHYSTSEHGKVLRYVLVFFLFTIVIISVVFEQKNVMRYETNVKIKEYYEKNHDWIDLPEVWSVAMYRNGELQRSAGVFRYTPFCTLPAEFDDGIYRVYAENNEHYMFIDGADMTVVSQMSWSDTFCFIVNTTFTFFVYLTLSFIFSMLWLLIGNRWIVRRSFFVKVQTLMVFFLLCCLVLLFGLTVWFVNYKYVKTVKRNQSQRMETLVNYFQPVLGGMVSDSIAPEVNRLSEIYGMDVIVYDSVGNLLISTLVDSLKLEPNIFRSENNPFVNMPSNVYSKMYYGSDKVLHIQSYCILFDKNHHPVYMMLSSASEIRRVKTEIAFFFVIILNAYFLLAIVCMLISYFLARQLVAPFVELENKFNEISRTGEYVKIECSVDSDEELIHLARQYNIMVDKLESSMAELSRTERDSSWRDMSRQMAHEIKNPLTPMRLLAQQIIAFDTDDFEQYKKRVRETLSILLTEINTLIETAEALSAFAKIPMARPSRVNVVERIRQIVELFRYNESSCSIKLKINTDEACVYIDKDAFVQMCNNLLKNALQSIPDDREGHVVVTVIKRIDNVLIKVADNGCGISDEIKSRIFDAQFSTKTQGMGVGLSVVKSVVDGVGGTIDFSSTVNKGTTFSVCLPLMSSASEQKSHEHDL